MNKQKIIKRVSYWRKVLGMENWDIHIYFKDIKRKEDNETFEGGAKTICEPAYLMATITFRPKFVKRISDQDIIHELLHCLVSELAGYYRANNIKSADKWITYFEERTVSQLTEIILRVNKN